jgi:hypothetical protein
MVLLSTYDKGFKGSRPMKRLFILSAAVISLLGCGPEQSNLEKEKDQMNTLFRQNKAELDQFAGDYVGTWTNNNVSVKSVLRVRSFTKTVVSPNRIETIEIPTIVAFISNTPSSGAGEIETSMAFGDGAYDKDTQTLRFYGPGKVAISFQMLELQIKGSSLVGTYLNDRYAVPVRYTKSSAAILSDSTSEE